LKRRGYCCLSLAKSFAPVRGRGLKRDEAQRLCPERDVRPRTGARIETGHWSRNPKAVACSPPYGGAD